MALRCSTPDIFFVIGIVMEYVNGRTLREYLDERPSRKELLRISFDSQKWGAINTYDKLIVPLILKAM